MKSEGTVSAWLVFIINWVSKTTEDTVHQIWTYVSIDASSKYSADQSSTKGQSLLIPF